MRDIRTSLHFMNEGVHAINGTEVEESENTTPKMPSRHIQCSDAKVDIKIWIALLCLAVLDTITTFLSFATCGGKHNVFTDSFNDTYGVTLFKAFFILVLTIVVWTRYRVLIILYAITVLTVLTTSLDFIFAIVKFAVVNAEDNFDAFTQLCKGSLMCSPVFALIEFILLLIVLQCGLTFQAQRHLPAPNSDDALMKLNKKEILLLLLGWTLMFESSVAQVVATFYFGKVVDAALDSQGDMKPSLTLLGITSGVGCTLTMFRCWTFNVVDQMAVARLRKQLLNNIQGQDNNFFDKFRIDHLSDIMSSDTQVCLNIANWSRLGRYLLQMAGPLIGLLVLNVVLTLCVLGAALCVSAAAIFFGGVINKLQNKFKERFQNAEATAKKELSSLKNGGRSGDCSLFSNDVDNVFWKAITLALVGGCAELVLGALASIATVLTLWYVGSLLHMHANDPKEGISAGDLIAFILFLVQLGLAFAFTLQLNGEFSQKARGARNRLTQLQNAMKTTSHAD